MKIDRSLLLCSLASVGLLWSTAAWGADLDGDGVADGADNCPAASNPTQLDGDLDGLGDSCDFDHNNDGRVDDLDGEMIRSAWGTGVGDAGFDPALDADGDGLIGGTDWSLFVRSLE